MGNFKKLQGFVTEMKNTSSLITKKEILGKHSTDDFITKVLEYTYNPYKQFHATSSNCKKRDDLVSNINNYEGNIFGLLDDLTDRTITGHKAIEAVNAFVFDKNVKGYEDIIYSIIDKNLEIRASDSVINKVIPDLIPTFDVALARPYESKLVDFENETWYASRKLDGVRCVIVVDSNGDAKAYSRQGKEFSTLSKVIDAIESFTRTNVIFDGELCLIDDEGNEDFQGVMKEIRKKDHTIENPKYKIFDVLPLEDFGKKSSAFTLGDRLLALKESERNFNEYLGVLPQVIVEDDDHFAELNADAQKKGYEGLMLRKDVGYEGKRTKNLLKVKSFWMMNIR